MITLRALVEAMIFIAIARMTDTNQSSEQAVSNSLAKIKTRYLPIIRS